MNHDYLDITFWAQFEGESIRWAYTVYADTDLIYMIDECLRVVVAKTPEKLLCKHAMSTGRRVMLYKKQSDEIPFATARLEFEIKTVYRLDLVQSTDEEAVTT